MGVHVDESGGDEEALGINNVLCVHFGEVPNHPYFHLPDPYVGFKPGVTSSVYDPSVFHDKVKHHFPPKSIQINIKRGKCS